MPSWVCQWTPFWIPVGESCKKAFLEEWVFVSGDSSDGQNVMDFPVLHSTDHADCIPETPNSILFLGNPRGLKIRLVFGSDLRHHCLRCGHGQNATSFIHDNSVPFLSAWNCHFQMMKSCAVTNKLSPQEQTNSLRGSR